MEMIQAIQNTRKIQGKINYNDSVRAWNIIRFKKEFLQEFQQLKNRQEKFSYEMLLFYTYEELEKAIKEMKNTGKMLPVLFWIGKEGLK
ncbi:MAG: hypothetical protein Q8R18_04970 [bacterium]|nr:hypothetical protein [bacterium]